MVGELLWVSGRLRGGACEVLFFGSGAWLVFWVAARGDEGWWLELGGEVRKGWFGGGSRAEWASFSV